MSCCLHALILAAAIWTVANAAARAEVIVDHRPHPTGGPGADTELINMGGQPSWQLAADDIRISVPAMANQLVWWGFYDQDNPPQTESMRVTLYAPRADGLPGAIISQQTLVSFSRVWTGRYIPVTVLPREFRYEADLVTPLVLAADTLYWVEIVQVGSLESAFRWEYSLTERDGFGFANPSVPAWQHSVIIPDLAFQLVYVPEPASIALMALALAFAIRRRRGTRIRALAVRRVGAG